ncbi:MAG: ABC transporter permease [Anaerolineaceae bacterium]|nr:ABC transporter permease [Anaerolineaceae bacterium]
MLSQFFPTDLSLGIAQAVIAAIISLLVLLLSYWQRLSMEKEIFIALIRALVQILAVGAVLVFILQGPLWLGVIILLLMMWMAAREAARRVSGIPGAVRVTFYGIFLGSGAVLVVMTFLGVIKWQLESMIPVGSMVISGGMNACALALDRFRGEVESHTGQIEAGLCLGAESEKAVMPYVQKAFRSSLIPRINALRALGIVWIPGLMSGMLLAGSDPVIAALYQFVVMAMIFVASSLSAFISLHLIRRYIFSEADQLLLQSKHQLQK